MISPFGRDDKIVDNYSVDAAARLYDKCCFKIQTPSLNIALGFNHGNAMYNAKIITRDYLPQNPVVETTGYEKKKETKSKEKNLYPFATLNL